MQRDICRDESLRASQPDNLKEDLSTTEWRVKTQWSFCSRRLAAGKGRALFGRGYGPKRATGAQAIAGCCATQFGLLFSDLETLSHLATMESVARNKDRRKETCRRAQQRISVASSKLEE